MQAYGDFAEVTECRCNLVEDSGINYIKLDISVEFMEVFTTSMDAPTTSTERSINLHDKIHFYEDRNFKIRQLAKIVSRHGGCVLSQTAKFNRGQNTRKVYFYKFGKKNTTIYKIKMCAQKCIYIYRYVLAVACRSCRVYV